MADDEVQILEDARRRPMGERTAHKLWKARVEAYEEMRSKCEKVFSEEDPILNTYGNYLQKAVIDTNAAALDKGLEFTVEYLKKCSVGQAAKACEKICTGLITKALSGRPGTVAKCIEVCLLLVEDEQGDKVAEAFITKGFDHKVPKVALICVDIVYQCICLFGTKVMTPQPILKALPPLFDSKDAKIRAKVKEMVAELAKWVGANAVKSILFEKMRDAMKEDVEKLISQIPEGKPVAQRLTRSLQQKQAMQEQTADAGGSSRTGPQAEEEPEEMVFRSWVELKRMVLQEIDDYELAEPSEVVGKLDREWWANMQEKKWSIRKGALSSLKTLASKPRLAPGDYGEINRELKKIITKDSNVQCVAEACWCVAALAKGLRNNFSLAKSYCGMLLEKFKEKNMSVCRACMEALTNLSSYCFTLLEVQEDVQQALKHQNPKVKQCTLEWMKICFDKAKKPVAAKWVPVFLTDIANCTDDATPLTRERAMAVLVSICLKATSTAAVDKITAKLDDTRKKKLDELLTEARSGGAKKPSAPAASAPSTSATPAAMTSKPATKKEDAMAIDPPASKKTAFPPKASKNKASTSSKPAPKPSTNYLAEIDQEALKKGAMTKEGAERGFLEVFGDDVVTGLGSTVWKERLAALEAIYEKLPSVDLELHGTLIIQGVAQLPGWNEKIFQVMGKQFEVLQFVIEKSAVIARPDAYAAIIGLLEKIADIKLKTLSWDILLSICEHLGLHFVFTLIYSIAKQHRNPKVLSEGLNWMNTAIQEFGLGPWIDTRTVINWVVEELGNTIPAVKNAAVSLIGSLHKFIGPSLADMIRPNVKPALMTTVEAEFGKNPQDTSFVAKRKMKGEKKAALSTQEAAMEICGEDDGDDGGAVAFNPDDILPRADISQAVNDKIAAQLNDANWKERKEAMEEIERLLVASGNRIQPTVGDLFPALKGRLSDANKNLIAQAIKVLSKIAIAMGKPIERQGKSIIEPALMSLSDAKPVVRTAVIELMDSWCSAGASLNGLFPEFIVAVASPKSHVDGKKDAIAWLNKMVADGKVGKESIENCVKACAVGLSDKANQVREMSLTLLQTLLEKFGDAVTGTMGSVEDSQRQTLRDAIQKVTGIPQTAAAAVNALQTQVVEIAERPKTPQKKGGPSKKSKTRDNGKVAAPPALATEAIPLFLMNNQKAERAHRNRGKRAKFDGIPPDEEPQLKAEMEPVVAPTLHALLFAPDFKKHCAAAELIKESLTNFFNEILESIDFIFRWSVVRIHEGKIQCLTSVLEMLKSLFEKLASEEYRMTEYEAVILLPTIVDKSGHNQDRIKRLHRDILCLATTIHPSSKVFKFVSQGLASKNTRTKVECAEELGSMINRDGMKIASGKGQSKTFEEIAVLVADRDKALRAACLSTLTIVYDFEGSRIWKLLGKLSTQQKSLIEERFKTHHKYLMESGLSIGYRGSRPSTPIAPSRLPTPDGVRLRPKDTRRLDSGSTSNEGIPRPPSQISQRSIQSPTPIPYSHELETRLPMNFNPLPNPTLPPVNTVAKPFAARSSPVEMSMSPLPPNSPETSMTPQRSDSVVEETWSRAMIMIQSEDAEESIDSLKIICYELAQAKSGTASTIQLLKDSANELVKELVQRFQKAAKEIVEALENRQTPPSERACKYTLNTLLQTFIAPFMAPAVEKDILLELVTVLLLLLLDDRLTQIPEGHTIMKGMNVLMLKILEMSQLNSVMGVLIFLLRLPPPIILQSSAEKQNRFFNLVVKCLIKATKRMGNYLESDGFNERDFDIGDVLLKIHDFFEKIGPDELRQRGEADDKPLRMVKTILYELCRFKGGDIVHYLDAIPKHGSPPPIILAYIDVNLQTLHSTGLLKGPLPAPISQGSTVIQKYFTSIDDTKQQGQEHVHTPESPARSVGTTTPVSESRPERPESANNELKTELAMIFKKIGDRRMTQEGLECLYQFQLKHPEVDVKPFLGNTSAAFQTYIEKGLRSIHERQKPSEPDPMDIDNGHVEAIEEMQITWAESPDGRYIPTESEVKGRQAASYHQPVNS